MMTPRALTINDQSYTRLELNQRIDQRLQSKETPDWERDVYQFLKDWMSDSPTIEMQTSGSTGTPKTIT
ncbi:long-chain fatty acid--CoA ligase, partial [bacterium]|nr:long-chain fatty acid--CoA ligase [bacterium]